MLQSGILQSSLKIRHATFSDVGTIAALLCKTFYTHGWQAWVSPLFQLGIHYDLCTRMQNLPRDSYQCWIVERVPPAGIKPVYPIVGTIEVGLRTLYFPSLQGKGTHVSDQVAYISNLAVDVAYRQQGIGQALLERCEQQVSDWNHQQVYLHVKSNNIPALSLYRKLGYKKNGSDFPLLQRRNQRTLLKKRVLSISA